MDYHVIIVIACVFLASLFSILFINKFFKNKTYEEAAAEKKALVEKLYPTKINKKIRKISVKRETKKDKKQRHNVKEIDENEIHDSEDIEEEENVSKESSPNHNIITKPHVEFSPSHVSSNEQGNIDHKGIKQQQKKKQSKPGILSNKTEMSPINDNIQAETLNHFEQQHPKDFVELKKQHKDDHIVTQPNENKISKNRKEETKKINKSNKKDNVEQVIDPTVALKEEKVIDTKTSIQTQTIPVSSNRTDSPKTHGNKKTTHSNKLKHNSKDVSLFDKIGQNDIIGVNGLIQIFSKAELNRNDIQILIDFLLNKQQDTTVVAHEWSDDIVTKLRKQLSEKEKALQDEIEASAGIQAKLKELRVEINTEKAQFNANLKAYTEELQTKKNEIAVLTSDIQNLNDKMQIERQQFQAKLRHEKQVSSQELLTEMQQINEHNTILQSEIVQKNSYINELQRLTNASHQTVEEHKQKLAEINDIYQQKLNQIHSLESGLAEANETIQRLKYDLEMVKISENEKENNKVEIRNLQNALETAKSELDSANNQVNEFQQKIATLNNELDDIRNQFSLINSKCQEYNSESLNLKNSIENYKKTLSEKDNELIKFEDKLKLMLNKEDDLMKQISEQREKNNDLRTKNWKLNEALQTAETSAKKLAAPNNKTSFNNLVVTSLFQRLFPDAVKKHSSIALSVSFDQWVEKIIQTHIEDLTTKIKQNQFNNISSENFNSNNKNNNNNNHHTPHNHNSNNSNNNSEDLKISNISSNSSNINNNSNDNNSDLSQIKLKTQMEEFKEVANKTENLLKSTEVQDHDQDAHWRKIVDSKQEEINLLENENGKENI